MATPALRIRIAPKFPVNIQGRGGVTVTRTGGKLTLVGPQNIVNLASLLAADAIYPTPVTVPAGQSWIIQNPDNFDYTLTLQAGASAVEIGQNAVRYYTPSNIPAVDAPSSFVPVTHAIDFARHGDALSLMAESIDTVTLDFGSYRTTGATLGTFPNGTDKAGWLQRDGKDTVLHDLLYTDTGGLFTRSATLVGGVLTWGGWTVLGPTPTAPMPIARGGTGATTATGVLTALGIRYDFPSIADDAVGVIDLGATNTIVEVTFQDNDGNGGRFCVRAAGSPRCRPGGVTVGSITIDATTGALTGTTGVDGRWTVSADDTGKIYVENRSGSGRSARVWVMR